MNSADFWASVHAIIADGFTPEGLQKLDTYAEQFISGRLIYQRFSPREQYGCAAGGEANVIASLLAGAEDRADSDAAQALSEFQRECQRGAQQEAAIEQWAKAVGFELKNPRNWTYATPDIYLSDMHDENVIRSETGSICVADCDIRINTPELRQGGIRELMTEIELD